MDEGLIVINNDSSILLRDLLNMNNLAEVNYVGSFASIINPAEDIASFQYSMRMRLTLNDAIKTYSERIKALKYIDSNE